MSGRLLILPYPFSDTGQKKTKQHTHTPTHNIMNPKLIALFSKHFEAFLAEAAGLAEAPAASTKAETGTKETKKETKKDKKEAPAVDLPTLRALGMKLVQSGKQDKLKEICGQFDCESLTKMSPDNYDAAHPLLVAAVEGEDNLL